MNDLITLAQIALVLIATVTPIVLLVRLVAGQDDYGFHSIVLPDSVLTWPKGVQEEEPQPWNFGAGFGDRAHARHDAMPPAEGGSVPVTQVAVRSS